MQATMASEPSAPRDLDGYLDFFKGLEKDPPNFEIVLAYVKSAINSQLPNK